MTNRSFATPIFLAALLFAVPASAATEDFSFSAGTKGLSFALPSGGAPTVGITYFLSSTAAVRLDVGLNFQISNASPTGGSDLAFSAEGSYRLYLARVGNGRLYPFLQPGVFFSRTGGGAPFTTIAFEGSGGVEYFLLDHFSVAAATGLALTFTNIGAASGGVKSGLTTGTSALFANFYF